MLCSTNVVNDFICRGNIDSGGFLYKSTRSKLLKPVFVWYDEDSASLCWNKGSQKGDSYKKLMLTDILKIKKACKAMTTADISFQIFARNRKYTFIANNREERISWMKELNDILTAFQLHTSSSRSSTPKKLYSPVSGDENQELKSPDIKRKRTVPAIILSEVNKDGPLGCSRELFTKGSSSKKSTEGEKKESLKEIMKILNRFIEGSRVDHAPLPKISCLEEIPSRLEEFISREENSIRELEAKVRNQASSFDTQGYQEKLNFLQAKISSLEIDKEKYDKLHEKMASLKSDIHKEKLHSQELVQTLESLHLDKAKNSRECRVYKSELDFSMEKMNQLEHTLLRLELETGSKAMNKKFEPIIKGFRAEVIENSQLPQNKFISCSPDFKKLIWREIGMTCISKSELKLVDVHTLNSAASSDNTHYTITLLYSSNNLSLTVSDSEAFKLLLIKELWQDMRKPQTHSLDSILTDKYKSLCDFLESQIRLEERLIKQYKKSLTENICNLSNGMSARQSAYNSEVDTLKEFNSRWVTGLVSNEVENYITKDRQEMLNRLKDINQQIALQNKDTLEAKEESIKLRAQLCKLESM